MLIKKKNNPPGELEGETHVYAHDSADDVLLWYYAFCLFIRHLTVATNILYGFACLLSSRVKKWSEKILGGHY